MNRAWVICDRNLGTLGKFALWIFTVLAIFLIARAIYPFGSHLRKEGFILAHSIRDKFHHGGENNGVGAEVSWTHTSILRNHKENRK